jgi:hypothetical protein
VGEGGRFDIMAERPPHFGFGGRCAPLHRALAGADRHVRGAAADRTPDAEPALHGGAGVRPVSGLTGPVELPIAFDRERAG